MLRRSRRLRHNPELRRMVRDVHLGLDDFIQPLFICEGNRVQKPLESIPGQYIYSPDMAAPRAQDLYQMGLSSLILFGSASKKDTHGHGSLDPEGALIQGIEAIGKAVPDMFLIADICLCAYTDHSHCGPLATIHGRTDVDNDQTLKIIGAQAVAYAKAGVHMVAPSGVMDGGVLAIRQALDQEGFSHIPIMGYSVKYTSSLYAGFREVLGSSPKQGTRASYQMDFRRKHEALLKAQLDCDEGADMLMVKPAHTYLDIIYRIKEAYPELPLAAYHTSGECAMLNAAIQKGWLPEDAIVEVLTAIKRAGADLIITYFGDHMAKILKSEPRRI